MRHPEDSTRYERLLEATRDSEGVCHRDDASDETSEPTRSFLSDQQRARIEAMQAVALYTYESKLVASGRSDSLDLMRLTEFILSGRDLLDEDGAP